MVYGRIEGAPQPPDRHFGGLLFHDIQHGVLPIGTQDLALRRVQYPWPALAPGPGPAQRHLGQLVRGQYGCGGHHRGAGARAPDGRAGDEGRSRGQIKGVYVGELVSQLRETANLSGRHRKMDYFKCSAI